MQSHCRIAKFARLRGQICTKYILSIKYSIKIKKCLKMA
nr:MAG TPA: hypothetical protein [Caudoviricetes sp.]